MPLLIGYLVALAVFLGGSYAGVQWLVAPSEPSAHAESAATRLVNAKKIRDARAQHRKLAESLAEEGAKPAAAPHAQVQVETPPQADAATGAPPASVAAAEAPTAPSKPEAPAAAAVASDSRLNARAEAASSADAHVKPIEHAREVQPLPKTETKKPVAQKSAPAEKAPAVRPSEPAVRSKDVEAPPAKKEARVKKQRVERVASSSRKPVMMILRTIEFPDGHREQRLLPMSEASASAPRYGVSAFAEDDDF